MQCTGAAKPGVFKWTITRRGPVIADVRCLQGMSPDELLSRLSDLLPGLNAHWYSADNCFRHDDSSSTLHGVFAACSHYVRGNWTELSTSQWAALGSLVSDCMVRAGSDLDNAAATCFLENLAHEPCSSTLAGYLSGEAQNFFALC